MKRFPAKFCTLFFLLKVIKSCRGRKCSNSLWKILIVFLLGIKNALYWLQSSSYSWNLRVQPADFSQPYVLAVRINSAPAGCSRLFRDQPDYSGISQGCHNQHQRALQPCHVCIPLLLLPTSGWVVGNLTERMNVPFNSFLPIVRGFFSLGEKERPLAASGLL